LDIGGKIQILKRLKGLSNYFFAIISSFLLILSIVVPELYFLEFVAFLPYLFALTRLDYKNGFISSVIVGYLLYSSIFFIKFEEGLGYILIVTAAIIPFILNGLIFQFFMKRKRNFIMLFIPGFWVLIEILFNFWSLPFNFGAVQHTPYFLQIADVYGIYGVTFLVFLINIIVFYILYNFFDKDNKKWYIDLIYPLFILAFILSYNFYTSKLSYKNDVSILISVIQGNLTTKDYELKYVLKNLSKKAQNRYIDLIRKVKPLQSDYIIVPESGFQGFVKNIPLLNKKVISIAKESNAYIVFQALEKQKGEIYKKGYVVSPSGQFFGSISKSYFFPFGETGTPSKEPQLPIQTTYPIGLQICYDVAFPYVSRNLCKNGATWLVTLANDEEFVSTVFYRLHLNLAIIRAVENRKYVVLANNSGISAIINPNGIIEVQSRYGEITTLSAKIYPNHQKTIFQQYGNLGTCLFVLMYILIGIILYEKYTFKA